MATSTTTALPELAHWLAGVFSALPKEYERGRQELVKALMKRLECPADEANRLLDELERAGYLRYAAESRSIGGSPGTWVIYPTPGENPDVSTDPSTP
ncbi:MAG TPA: hypothetical protein VK698_06620 [Kofleriaceae bacterium]|nr:hypothetical protein [Kofleriaceae bacterium]